MNTYRTESVPKMEDLIPLIEEGLAAGQDVRFSPHGTSMLPMLRQDIDSVVLSPVSGKLQQYDLPLYRRDDGKYILHRVIRAGDTYTCMGDNQFAPEAGIRQDQLIAVVTAFYRADRIHQVTDTGYRLYCRIWYHSRHIRRFVRRAVGWLRRHIRK